MSDFVPIPRDRLEGPICNAIESRDFKQALKLVEKRLSKSTDPYLQALKCFVQCHHSLVVERGKGFITILDLCDASEKHHAAAELDLYDESIKSLFPGNRGQESDKICKMRADAVKAEPNNEKLGVACFRACLKRENLEYAQQISPVCPTEKASIYRRLAYSKIKNIAATTLKVTDENVPSSRCLKNPQELLLFHRLLKDSGNDDEGISLFRDECLGPTSKVAKGEWVFRRKQLELMVIRKEWVELYNTCYDLLKMSRANNNIRTISDARGADWAIWKGYLRAVLELKSLTHVHQAHLEMEAHLELKSGIDKTYRKNAALAMLVFAFSISPGHFPQENLYVRGVNDALPPRILILGVHLYRYGHTASAFGDIVPYLENLSIEEQKLLLLLVPKVLNHNVYWSVVYSGTKGWRPGNLPKEPPKISEWDEIISDTTQTKLEYFLKSSMAETARKAIIQGLSDGPLTCTWCSQLCKVVCKSCLEMLAMQSLQAYGWAIEKAGKHVKKKLKSTDKHPADEWAILATMCLIKLGGCSLWVTNDSRHKQLSFDVQSLLRATAVLEFAHIHSKANPQISLLLIRLYSQLGAGSLAMRAYHRLGLKQIQSDTLSYTLFDRISSLHPHSVADESSGSLESLSPSTQLTKLQRLYRGFRDHVVTNSWRSFENGNYDSVFQLMKVSSMLSRSMASAMSAVELRKIARFTNPDIVLDRNTHGYDILASEPAEVEYSNNSDYASFPNYEHSKEGPFEIYTRIAPGPSQARVRAFLLLEEFWMVLSSSSMTMARRAAAHARLNESSDFRRLVKVTAKDSTDLTRSEDFLVSLGLCLMDIIGPACDTDAQNVEDIQALTERSCTVACLTLATFKKYVDSTINVDCKDWIPTFMTTLHPLYTAYEAGKLALAFADYMTHEDIWSHEGTKQMAARIKKDANELQQSVRKIGAMVRKRLNEGHWLDFVLDRVRTEDSGSDNSILGGDETDELGSDDAFTAESSNLDNDRSAPMEFDDEGYPVVPPLEMSSLFTEYLGSDFLEYWAGELVDSWRESAMGLACLKFS